MNLNFSPKSLITFGIFSITIVLFVNVYTVLKIPSLGIVWGTSLGGELFVKEVFSDSPAQQAHIPIGKIMVAIGYGDISEPLSAMSLTEEPDNLGEYNNVSKFFIHQDNILHILSQGSIWLESKDNVRYIIQPKTRHILWLPPMYWFQLICGLLSFFAGIAVFAFRRQDPASQVYALNGVSFTIVTFAAAIYSGRELAISGDLFRLLSALNHFGALWFTATFIALAWHVPRKLNHFSLTKTLLLLFTLFWVADTLRWQTSSPELWMQLPILFGLLASIGIAVIQWRICKQRPDDKLALRWLLLSLLLPGILFLSLTIVLQWLGIELLVPQGYAFGILLVMYLGISLGVTRFALFELDKWWASIWLWILTGVSFIAIDISLASLLHLTEEISTLFALVVVGFIYIPIRQKIFSRILKAKEVSLEGLIPQVLNLVTYVNNPQKLEQGWQTLLKQAFSPLSIKEDGVTLGENVTLKNNGVALYIPNIGMGPALILEYPNQGARLFSNADVAVITSLIQMMTRALEDTQSYQKGIAEERMRIAEDLHDDLGAKLLSLVYKSETTEQKKLARQAMSVLREVISSSHNEKVLFIDQALDWKNECQQRASENQAHLLWKQCGIFPQQKIPVNISIQLSKVLREALSNALKHGNAKRISVRVHVKKQCLLMSLHNNGTVFCEVGSGNGLSNMKRRIKSINGVIRWAGRKNGGCHVAWVVPISNEV